MRALVLLGCIAIIAAAILIAIWMVTRVRGARQDRRDLAGCKAVLAEINVIALQAEALDPSAALIAEKIRQFHITPRQKEAR